MKKSDVSPKNLANSAKKPTLEPKTLKQSKQKKPKPEKKLSPKKQEKNRKKKEYEEALNGQEWNAKIIAPKGVTVDPQLAKDRTILSVRHLKVFFQSGEYKTKAVHDVSFDVKEGETFGIVGESGCGKTTTGRSIIGLYKPTSGAIYYKGVRIAAGSRYNEKEIKWSKIHAKEEIKKWREDEHNELSDASDAPGEKEAIQARYDKKIAEKQKALDLHVKEQEALIKQIQYDNRHSSKKLRQQIQMIFQDPIDSLDPRMTVEDIICEGLHIQGLYNKKKNREIVAKVLERVGLIPEYASRYPHEFSVMNPKILICDEPISALDVSIRAQVLNLLNEVKQDMNLTMLFIAHDLSVVKYFCDRIAVMYFGNMVELASSDELFLHPLHPYTQALLSAIPKPDPLSESSRERKIYNPAETHDYSVQKPTFREILPGHFVLCNDEEEKAYREKVAQIDRQPKEEEK